MLNNSKKDYAEQWDNSAEYFRINNDYEWMCNCIKDYSRILEVGCGTGQSTLSLLKAGHKVISIDTNEYCINTTRNKVIQAGLIVEDNPKKISNADLILINGDISDDKVIAKLISLDIDILLCWNIGSYWSEKMLKNYLPKMINYGLNVDQINSNLESSYAEYIIWQTCKVAKTLNSSIHLIDRNIYKVGFEDKQYYNSLKNEFSFNHINFMQRKTITISSDGRALVCSNKIIKEKELNIYLTSVLIS